MGVDASEVDHSFDAIPDVSFNHSNRAFGRELRSYSATAECASKSVCTSSPSWSTHCGPAGDPVDLTIYPNLSIVLSWGNRCESDNVTFTVVRRRFGQPHSWLPIISTKHLPRDGARWFGPHSDRSHWVFSSPDWEHFPIVETIHLEGLQLDSSWNLLLSCIELRTSPNSATEVFFALQLPHVRQNSTKHGSSKNDRRYLRRISNAPGLTVTSKCIETRSIARWLISSLVCNVDGPFRRNGRARADERSGELETKRPSDIA